MDVEKLMNGQSVSILKTECYYADYLKILLLLLPEEIELERMRRCIEEQLQIDLSNCYVEVQRKGEFYYDYQFTEKYYHEERFFEGSFITQ